MELQWFGGAGGKGTDEDMDVQSAARKLWAEGSLLGWV